MLTDIVIISDYAHVTGGSAKVAIESAIGLAERGLRVHFLSAVSPIDERLQAADVTVYCLEQRDVLTDPNRFRATLRGLWNRPAARKLAQILQALPQIGTVVHFHQWSKALSASVFRAAHNAGVPCVVTFHDYFVSCPNGAFLNYPRSEVCPLRPLSRSCVLTNCDSRSYGHKLWRVMRQQLQDWFGRVPRKLRHGIHVSDLNRRVLEPYMPTSMIWHYVPNPVDTVRMPRFNVKASSEYIFIGRLSPEKGSDVFAKAADAAGVRAVIVGDGPQEESLKVLNPNAEFTGWLDHSTMIERLRRARALVIPSRWFEGHPLVIGNAFAHGLPIVASDVCAAADAVTDGRTGFHFRNGDFEDLAAKLRKLEDNELLDRLSRAAYAEFWSDPPLIEQHVSHLISVYRSIAEDVASVTPTRP